MEVTGTVIQILEIETGQGKKEPWQKQNIILETPGQYKKKVCVTFWGAQTDSITRIGHEVKVHVNPESRCYNDKWYTELRAWKVEQNSSAGSQPPQGSRISQEAEGNRATDRSNDILTTSTSADPNSDLPF